MSTDATFITNEKDKKLKDRLVTLINDSKELKFLVGFFYFSGISELYDSLKKNPTAQVDVLVGLNVDSTIHGLVEYGDDTKSLTNDEIFDKVLYSLYKSINSDHFDTESFYQQVKFFIELILNDKLRIRKTREPNHAKLYIFKIKDDLKHLKNSFMITGSSNLTKSGLYTQGEFNVEISDYGTNEAEKYFDDLWLKSVRLTEEPIYKEKLVELIKKKTLVTDITPFEAFTLVLKTYIDLQNQKQVKPSLKELLIKKGYKPYKYQLDAVSQALTIIENNYGVIISDVVGLGKSIIAGMIVKSLGKRGIIICPPGLIGDDNKTSGWQKYKEDFELYDWEVRSCGLENLQKTLALIKENPEYEVIIVDEVHRFRNQDTEAYETLSNICRDKLVLLLTATPFNNTPADIFSLLKLFIIPGKSQITLDNDLTNKFRGFNQSFKKLSNIKKNFKSLDKDKRDSALSDYESLFGSNEVDLVKVKERSKYLSKSIRQVIEPVLIRRNRIDLKKDPEYSKEVIDLSEIHDPHEALFELNEKQSDFYDRIISQYFGENGDFYGAIYRPFIYETGIAGVAEGDLTMEQNREALMQSNLYDFMRRLLIKRFESSFGAFQDSIQNFLSINLKVQQFIIKTGEFILDRKLINDIWDDSIDDIGKALADYQKLLDQNEHPKTDKVYKIKDFKLKNKFLTAIQSDINLFKKILAELESLDLVNNDPKFNKLSSQLKEIIEAPHPKSEPQRKVVIFTEYVDTAKYLEKRLDQVFNGQFLTVAGGLSKAVLEQILQNFDAMYKGTHKDQYKFLLATDKISEGFNLNRAGSVINYDIPWNPTRVIQRVGRINRIGKKVFAYLDIYNFFPTLQGSEFVKSREIAAQKMFMIHNTLGEDAKIFEPDEEPSAASLFKKVMANPDTMEDTSFQTKIRQKYFAIAADNPEVIKRISELPARVKVAKNYTQSNVLVFIRKGLGFFIRGKLNDDKLVSDQLFEDTLAMIECSKDEKAMHHSPGFWQNYLDIKDYQYKSYNPTSDVSVEKKALNNIKTLINNHPEEISDLLPFLRTLLEDMKEYKTLSDYTVRRISNLKTVNPSDKDLNHLKDGISGIRKELGDDYLEKIKAKLGKTQNEVIIAIENIKG
ncbi:MAG: helicase [Dehalococcoides mccartyi]|uniref:helicase-related protein n=1 Tax=Dehalococcoides mccartyi TaxID=61435 RepID=UPI000804CD23|nr:helicase-related protein [Dehalococcoides mccartyi]OBW62942.1 MAG: helicase [Dehalococcoides mccartyi]